MASLFQRNSLTIWILIGTLFVVVAGGAFFYRLQLQQQVPFPAEDTQEKDAGTVQEVQFVWEEHVEEVRQLIGATLPECSNIPGNQIEIMETADITGDGVKEAMASTGCTGAYTTHAALFSVENGKPVFSRFIGEQGELQETRMFFTGASVQNYNHVGMIPEYKLVYQASGSLYPSQCRVEWDVLAFVWSEQRRAFVFSQERAITVRERSPEKFPPYFDPMAGLTQDPVEDCSFEATEE